MDKKYRFAVMILFFDCENFILRTIENCAPFVDKIYILYSELPYGKYNPEARNKFRNASNKNILKESKYFDKIDLIEGDWYSEEEQRNECLMKAKSEGFDFLIVQDADEFYLPNDYKKNIIGISENPDYSFYQVPWVLFWKNTEFILQYRKHGKKRNVTITDCPMYAVNLRKEVYFKRTRTLNTRKDFLMLDGLCLHLSWVLSDNEVHRKISTWSHSHQVNIDKWYKWKWLAWNNSTKNIGVTGFIDVKKAIKYTGQLPEEVKSLPNMKQHHLKLSYFERFQRWINDIQFYILLLIKWPYYLIRYKINIL